MTTAVIIDDHAAIVAGVGQWCAQADPPIELLDTGGNLAGAWTGPGAAADVVILDVEAPGSRGATALRRLVEVGRRVVVYAQHTDRGAAERCLSLGVHAYVPKCEGADRLVPAIRAAAAGRTYLSPAMSGAALADSAVRPKLTPRELEVLRAWFASPSKQLVAAKLYLSVKTVDTYIQRVRAKYANAGRHAPTKSDLVTRVLDDGFISIAELTA
ncbi:response regulator transcription factor [Saccharothrix luteola]|uniref:response regulator transcription factor n=1 Tax=Saccharothrix luteola TaxID=2893018 RepID=UPI001E49B322|nr:response regulator transcription factor [Saccharothrix luteola]MCC8245555.1 response regulator transcription factor [Saccharothrix luteola]